MLRVALVVGLFANLAALIAFHDWSQIALPVHPGLSVLKLTESYACGYMAGQRAIWRAALPSPISPEWPDYCTPFKTVAFANGFTNE